MKIGDFLYFAPGIRFDSLDLASPEIVDHFRSRIRGYYLGPARMLADQGHAFGAVVLLASAIVALARFERPARERNQVRYTNWSKVYVPSLGTKDSADKFYDDFRCGVVHEGRAKKGCVFTTEIGRAVWVEDGIMAVHPVRFWEEISQVLETFCARTLDSPALLQNLQRQLRDDFKAEMRIAPVAVALEATDPSGI